MTIPILSVHNLHISVGEVSVLKGVSISLVAGETHVLMGPNGSGKSTLAHAIMGNPLMTITSGGVELCGEDITHNPSDERAKKGIYLGFQHPAELNGVNMTLFLRSVLASRGIRLDSETIFKEQMGMLAKRTGLSSLMLDRNVNEGFSGGEKKRNEMLQLCVCKPRVAIMDEIDSGLDVDGSQMMSQELQQFVADGGALFFITHSALTARLLDPQRVYIMKEGQIIRQGNNDLLALVEKKGFESL